MKAGGTIGVGLIGGCGERDPVVYDRRGLWSIEGCNGVDHEFLIGDERSHEPIGNGTDEFVDFGSAETTSSPCDCHLGPRVQTDCAPAGERGLMTRRGGLMLQPRTERTEPLLPPALRRIELGFGRGDQCVEAITQLTGTNDAAGIGWDDRRVEHRRDRFGVYFEHMFTL